MTETRTEEYTISADESPSRAVVEAVADFAGCDSLKLHPPLWEFVNPDALDRLFQPPRRRADRRRGRVTFPYLDYRVTLHSHGLVEVSSSTPPVTSEEPSACEG